MKKWFGSFLRQIPHSGWELRILCSGTRADAAKGATGSFSGANGPALEQLAEGLSNVQLGSHATAVVGTAPRNASILHAGSSHLQASSSAMRAFLQATGGRITASKLSVQVAQAEPGPAPQLMPLSLADFRALMSCMGSLNSFAFNVHGSKTCKPMDAAAILQEVAAHAGARLHTLEVDCFCKFFSEEGFKQSEVPALVSSTVQRLEGLRVLARACSQLPCTGNKLSR